MRILDRYVATQYLMSLASCTGMLVVLYVIIDFFSKIEDFMSVTGQSVIGFIVMYYACRVPQFMLHLAPVITLIAAVLVLVRLVRQNELVPMLASGTSVVRIMVPILIIGCAVGAGMMAMEEYLLPAVVEPVRDSTESLEGNDLRSNMILRDELDNVLVVRHYSPKKRTMENVILMQTGASRGLIQEVSAKSARWTDEDGGGWIASDGSEYVFDGEGKRLAQRDFGTDGKRLVTKITPETMIQRREDGDFLTFARLREQVAKHPFEANLKVRLHEKLTFPLFNIILLGLGVPFVLRRDVRNLFVGGGICLIVCSVFFSSYFFLSDLGSKGEIDPVLAAWLPVVVFGGLSIYLLDTIPT